MEADPVRLMSTASYLEVAIVIETRFGGPGGRDFARTDIGVVGEADS